MSDSAMIADKKYAPEQLGRVLVLGLGKSGHDAVDFLMPLLGGRVSELAIFGGAHSESADAFAQTARAAGAPVFHGDARRPDTLLAAGLTHAHLVVLTFAHAQQALRIAQAIAERRPALTLWVSCRSTTAADAFRAMPNVRVYQQSFAAAIGLAEQVMSTLGMSTELIEGHISAMRRRLDSSRFPGSSSS